MVINIYLTQICSWSTIYFKYIANVFVIPKHSIQNYHSKTFSEENLEEMFPRYYMQNYMFSTFKSLTTHSCVARRERVSKNDMHTAHNLKSKYISTDLE